MESSQVCACKACAGSCGQKTIGRNDENLQREIQILRAENVFLKDYLVTVRNNATLKTANALSSILIWSDRQLCQKFQDVFINLGSETSQFENSVFSSIGRRDKDQCHVPSSCKSEAVVLTPRETLPMPMDQHSIQNRTHSPRGLSYSNQPSMSIPSEPQDPRPFLSYTGVSSKKLPDYVENQTGTNQGFRPLSPRNELKNQRLPVSMEHQMDEDQRPVSLRNDIIGQILPVSMENQREIHQGFRPVTSSPLSQTTNQRLLASMENQSVVNQAFRPVSPTPQNIDDRWKQAVSKARSRSPSPSPIQQNTILQPVRNDYPQHVNERSISPNKGTDRDDLFRPVSPPPSERFGQSVDNDKFHSTSPLQKSQMTMREIVPQADNYSIQNKNLSQTPHAYPTYQEKQMPMQQHAERGKVPSGSFRDQQPYVEHNRQQTPSTRTTHLVSQTFGPDNREPYSPTFGGLYEHPSPTKSSSPIPGSQYQKQTPNASPNAYPSALGAKRSDMISDDWQSLVYQPPEMLLPADNIQNSSSGKKSMSEGYGSHIESEPFDTIMSDGRARIGDPVYTSTPNKTSSKGFNVVRDLSNTFEGMRSPRPRSTSPTPSNIKGLSILQRPIDSIIGLNPIFTEERRMKASRIQPNKRIIGEIAFQLDRRILEYVFAWRHAIETSRDKRRRFYGYTVNNMGAMIRKEAVYKDGKFNSKKELEMRYRFDYIVKSLAKFGYKLEKHSILSQDLVNRYGLLNGPPDRKTSKEMGLSDPVVLRVILSQVLQDSNLLPDVSILLDCLCLLAHDDKRPIFLY